MDWQSQRLVTPDVGSRLHRMPGPQQTVTIGHQRRKLNQLKSELPSFLQFLCFGNGFSWYIEHLGQQTVICCFWHLLNCRGVQGQDVQNVESAKVWSFHKMWTLHSTDIQNRRQNSIVSLGSIKLDTVCHSLTFTSRRRCLHQTSDIVV